MRSNDFVNEGPTKKVPKKKLRKKVAQKKVKKTSIEGEVRNLHSAISGYVESSSIEDWKDQARAIFRFVKDYGGKPLSGMPPAAIRIDGELFYLYRVKFEDLDGKERWIAYESETGIGEILDKEPNPKSFS